MSRESIERREDRAERRLLDKRRESGGSQGYEGPSKDYDGPSDRFDRTDEGYDGPRSEYDGSGDSYDAPETPARQRPS